MLLRSLFALSLIVAVPAAHAGTADEQCKANFTTQGFLATGKTFQTFAVHGAVDYDHAFDRTVDYIKHDEMVVVESDRSHGIIHAANPVIGGHGPRAVAPLRVKLTPLADGVRISAMYTISAGQLASKRTVRKHLCELVNSALD